jgi:hypothetical protein
MTDLGIDPSAAISIAHYGVADGDEETTAPREAGLDMGGHSGPAAQLVVLGGLPIPVSATRCRLSSKLACSASHRPRDDHQPHTVGDHKQPVRKAEKSFRPPWIWRISGTYDQHDRDHGSEAEPDHCGEHQ